MNFGNHHTLNWKREAACHQRSTLERVQQHRVVMAIQDTTELNFTHHPGKRGMGYLDNAKARGLKVHSVFCSTSGGVPLGVLHQQVWARDIANLGKKHQRHKKSIQDKESQRWLTAEGSYSNSNSRGNCCGHGG